MAASHSPGAPLSQAEARDWRDLASDEDIPPDSLDVSSESFDPLLALYSPHTPLPFPNARCFNNLAEYESFLRGRGRGRARAGGAKKGGRKGARAAPDPERIERLRKLIVVEEGEAPARPRRKDKAPRNVLTRMPLHTGSPLGELNRCIQDQIRIKVHIRTFKGLRGVCSGFIVAFDKFWNMAMVDVDETYRKPVLGKAFYNEPQLTLNKLFEKLELQESEIQPSTGCNDASTRRTIKGDLQSALEEKPKRKPRKKVDYQQVFTRHLKQIFIRGENILLINIAD